MSIRSFFLLLLLPGFAPAAMGQSPPANTTPTSFHLVEITAPKTLEAGVIGHFRARVSAPTPKSVNYLWDLGDGVLSVGALVNYAYSTPGTYAVTVVARNGTDEDTLQTRVRVVPVPVRPDSAHLAEAAARERSAQKPTTEETEPPRRQAHVTVSRKSLFGPGGIVPSQGGYTWVLKTDLWPERAQYRTLSYRLQGLRADVYVDSSGRGTPAHRIVAGQFATVDAALVARSWLPPDLPGVWLLELGADAHPSRHEK